MAKGRRSFLFAPVVVVLCAILGGIYGPGVTGVAAASALDANIASTTTIIRGARALEWLDAVGLPARLVSLDGAVVTVNGWPTDDAAVAVGATVS